MTETDTIATAAAATPATEEATDLDRKSVV